MKLSGHPSTHGHHVNPHTCGARKHTVCDGFSGDYDTYICGCCCHDTDLTVDERVQVARLRGEAP